MYRHSEAGPVPQPPVLSLWSILTQLNKNDKTRLHPCLTFCALLFIVLLINGELNVCLFDWGVVDRMLANDDEACVHTQSWKGCMEAATRLFLLSSSFSTV